MRKHWDNVSSPWSKIRPTANQMSVEPMQQIAEWLEKFGLGQYAQRFAANDIDPSVLRDLTDHDLEKIGVSLGHRRKILRAIAELEAGPEARLRVRVGIATGLVIVGDLIGEGASQEHGVVGETANLASRLQALAEPNTVVIDGSTRRLVGGLFESLALGNMSIT